MGAALAYYAVFSIGPFLVVAITIAGLIFGSHAATQAIIGEIGNLVGKDSATAVDSLATAAQSHSANLFATLIALGIALFGAAGVFGEMQDALDTIWKAEAREKGGLWQKIKERFISLSMVAGVSFLLLVSMVLSAALTAFGNLWEAYVHLPAAMLKGIDLVISLVVVSCFFAMIFKILPSVRVAWRDVWVGAAVTAVLFTLGKFALSLYIGWSVSASSYGAAGSLIVLIVWLYYSAQIFYFGAEFTRLSIVGIDRRPPPQDSSKSEVGVGRKVVSIPIRGGNMADQMSGQGEARKAYDEASSFASNLKDQASEQAEKAKSKMQEVTRKAGERMDEQRYRAADAIESGASALHEKAGNLPGGSKVTNIAHAAAEKMQATADYVRENDAGAMIGDVQDLVRRYPGQAVVAGIVLGFLLGRMFRRSEEAY